MAKLQLLKGTTSYIAQVFIQDSASTTGAGKSGLAFNTSSLTAYYHRDTDTTATAITLVTMTVGTFTSSGFKEIDATNMPGWYQLCIPNAAFASGAKNVGVHLQGASGMAPLPLEFELTGFDNQSVTDGGLSKLTSLTFTGANKADVSVRDWVGDTIPARSTTGVPKVDVQNWTGTAVSTPATAGIVEVNLKNIANAAVSASTAQLGVNVVNFGGSAGTFSSGRPEIDLNSGSTTELSAVPASTATLKSMLQWLFIQSRNKLTQTATTQIVKANDGSTTVGTSTVSDDGTTATRGAFS